MNKQIINLLTVGLTLLLTACGGSGNKGQAPELAEQSKLGTVHTLTPEYTFTSTLAGTIKYQGRCSSDTTQATEGENVVELKLSKWWITYDDCALTITTADGKTTSQLSISPFRTVYPAKHPLSDTGMTLCANFPRSADGSFPEPDEEGNHAEFKVGISCADFGVTQTEDGWDGESVIPAGQDATHGRDALAAQGKLEKVGAGHGGYDFTKLDKDGNELDYSAEEYACIRDNYTGLIWEVKTNRPRSSDLHSGDAKYLWYNPSPETNGGFEGYSSTGYDANYCSIEFCNTKKFIEVVKTNNHCGLNNWRLPTYAELVSIANIQSDNKKTLNYVDNDILKNIHATFIHTSNYVKNNEMNSLSNIEDHLKRYLVHFDRGDKYFLPAIKVIENGWNLENQIGTVTTVLVHDSANSAIEPLAGDETYEVLTVDHDATVLDKNTGLIWTRCLSAFVGDDNAGNTCNKKYSWGDALAAVQTANNNLFLGYSDWRLPSIIELASLQDFDRVPMINQNAFPIVDIENKIFWSSTVSANVYLADSRVFGKHFELYKDYYGHLKLYRLYKPQEMLDVLLVRGGK